MTPHTSGQLHRVTRGAYDGIPETTPETAPATAAAADLVVLCEELVNCLSMTLSELRAGKAVSVVRERCLGQLRRLVAILEAVLEQDSDPPDASGTRDARHPLPIPPSSATPRALPQQAKMDAPLTLRQREVLALLNAGQSPADIAALLCLSQSTVRAHVRDAVERLNVHHWGAAVAKARELGLLGEE